MKSQRAAFPDLDRFRRFLTSDRSSDALSSVMAVAVGLVMGLIILLISNPTFALGGFVTILTGGFHSLRDMGQVLYYATPIIMTGLSVGFAARTGLFNIGASGQFTVGAFAAILVGVKCSFLPGALHWMAALLAAMLAGALWGFIPGLLKAYRNVNEVISCIMMNYIGMFLVNYLIPVTGIYDSSRNQTMRVSDSANLPKMGLDEIFAGSVANSGIIIAVVMAILVYILLEKTTLGFELKACGLGKDAAKYAGINENRSIAQSMLIAGAMAGLGGALLYLAGAGRGINVEDVLAMEGFNGIPVALLGLNNPIGIIFSGFLIAYLNVGGFIMQLFDFAPQVIEIIIAIIIYFSAFALLFKGFIQSIAKKRVTETPAPDSDKGGDEK